MKNSLIILASAFVILVSCSVSQRDKDMNTITSIEEQLINDTTKLFNKKLAIDVIQLYSDFSDNYPTDSLSPMYLFKAGRLTMNMNNGNKAIKFFDKIITQYSSSEKVPETIFLSAFVHENLLNDNERAKQMYLKFMKLYPNNILYKDAKASIANMGKSLDEIIKGFEKNEVQQDIEVTTE